MKEHQLKPIAPPAHPEAKPDKILDSVPEPEQKEEKGKEGLYAVDYFQFKGWGEILLDERLDVHGSKEKLLFIESSIEKEIQSNGLKPGRVSFDAIISEIEKNLKISRFHDQRIRVEKVHKYLKILAKSASERRKIRNMIMKANREAERQKKHFV